MMQSRATRAHADPQAGMAAVARPVYFVSDRPEAYEIWGEVSHDEAALIGRTIVERATQHFPGIEFRVDGGWHDHPHGLERVAIYIDAHWQRWVAEILKR